MILALTPGERQMSYVCMYVCMVRLFVVSCIRSIKDRSRVLTPKLTVVDQRGLITNT